MQYQVINTKMKIPSSNSFKIIFFFPFIVLATTWAQNYKCPFNFIYFFGDGATDLGNVVSIRPYGPNLLATRPPYGITYPGRPAGRWSDGRNDADYTGQGLGLPNITNYFSPYLFTGIYDGVVFSIAGSTILDYSYFLSRRIDVTPTNVPLALQVTWFIDYANSNICTNPTECRNRQPQNSLFAFKHLLLNDMRIALLQGKSIQEITSFVQPMVQAQVDAGREVISQGATQIVYVTATPLGCSPDILTALSSDNSTAYDELGCLRAVNNVAGLYNTALQASVNALRRDYPALKILVADFYNAARAYIRERSVRDPSGNLALRSCCGIGGRYDFDSDRLCGSPNVPVCPNPNDYVYWDGIHFTQEAYRRISNKLLPSTTQALNCTT